MRKIIRDVVDADSFFELKPRFGKVAVTGLARLAGHTVGIIAKTPDSRTPTYRGYARIPGQSYIGSGIVLNEQGYILTNFHVIPSGVGELSVVLGDNIYEARFVGGRREYDLAVIKFKAGNLVPASLGDSDKAEQGDLADDLAIVDAGAEQADDRLRLDQAEVLLHPLPQAAAIALDRVPLARQ